MITINPWIAGVIVSGLATLIVAYFAWEWLK